jgi:hypothetical protein
MPEELPQHLQRFYEIKLLGKRLLMAKKPEYHLGGYYEYEGKYYYLDSENYEIYDCIRKDDLATKS